MLELEANYLFDEKTVNLSDKTSIFFFTKNDTDDQIDLNRKAYAKIVEVSTN